MLGIGWNKVFETSELFLVQHFVKVLNPPCTWNDSRFSVM